MNEVKQPVNAAVLSVSELNARRRKAVQLRLQGLTLAAVTEATGLSAPTVIAAHKAFKALGWVGVPVQRRLGRPRKAQPSLTAADSDLAAALWRAMLAGPPANMALWSTKAVGAWLVANAGVTLSAGSVSRLCEALGLPLQPALPAFPAVAAAEVSRYAGTELRLPKAAANLLIARTTRGQLVWLAVPQPPCATDYQGFFARLLDAANKPVHLSFKGARLLRRQPELATWLQQHNGRFLLTEPVEQESPRAVHPAAPTILTKGSDMTLTHLQRLEAESIHIMREVVAEADNPVMLYSIGKDSAVMLHLAMKAFYPAKPPFPLLHVDTRWKFREMYAMRERMARELGLKLLVHINPDGVAKDINPFTHGSAIHTDVMKTEGLKQALDQHGFDAAFGGARRDEEKSRAKERIFSFRTSQHRWDPKSQRPELWHLYNARKHTGESMRVFPLSNWTELDIWQYIYLQNIPIVPLYFAAERPVVERNGTLIMVDDDRMPLNPGEVPMMRKVRFRTLGCYPLTGAVESQADTLPAIIQEMLLTRTSERQGRVIDHDAAASMEKKKQEGYF